MSVNTSIAIPVPNPAQGNGSLSPSQASHAPASSQSNVPAPVQSTITSNLLARKGLLQSKNHLNPGPDDANLISSPQQVSNNFSATSTDLSPSTTEATFKTAVSLNVLTTLASAAPARDSFSTTANTAASTVNSPSSRASPSSFPRLVQSVPLHIYEDHSTATPSMYMTHHLLSATNVTPASPQSVQPNVSIAWPLVPRTAGQSTATASNTMGNKSQPSTVITAQPLPSASVMVGSMPASVPGGVTVGVVAPTVTSKLDREAPQQKQAWTTLAFPTDSSTSIASTASLPGALTMGSPAYQSPSSNFRSITESFASPGPSAKLTVPDIIKQVSTSSSQLTSESSKSLSLLDLERFPLHNACAKGDALWVQNLLKANNVDSNLPLKDGSTPVHYAVEYNQEGEGVIMNRNRYTVN